MEIKQGDKVRVSKDAPKMYLRGFDHIFTGVESVVSEVEDDNAVIIFSTDHINSQTTIPCKYLVKVDAEAKEPRHIFYGDYAKVASRSLEKLRRKAYPEWYSSTEPTERTEAENQAFTLGERVVTPYGYGVVGKDIEGRIAVALENGGFCGIDKAIKIIADNPVFDWDAYAADLAKEIVLKTVNSASDKRPSVIAEYATDVAKAVVEGFKRK